MKNITAIFTLSKGFLNVPNRAIAKKLNLTFPRRRKHPEIHPPAAQTYIPFVMYMKGKLLEFHQFILKLDLFLIKLISVKNNGSGIIIQTNDTMIILRPTPFADSFESKNS